MARQKVAQGTVMMDSVSAATAFPVGKSPAISTLDAQIKRVARYESTVLIQGESGCGKELVARRIHELSERRGGPFVPINCAAIPRELLESELFGHEKGSFTGALNTRIGRFELAARGTLFLDEIGDMTLDMQVKLLRVLQERTFERVGSVESRRADVRILAATHRDLEARVAERQFREDLFFRLNVVPIRVPPLRERIEDLPQAIGERRHRAQQLAETFIPSDGLNLREHLGSIEKHLIRTALEQTDGTVAHAARLLKLRRTTLVEKLRKYDLQTS